MNLPALWEGQQKEKRQKTGGTFLRIHKSNNKIPSKATREMRVPFFHWLEYEFTLQANKPSAHRLYSLLQTEHNGVLSSPALSHDEARLSTSFGESWASPYQKGQNLNILSVLLATIITLPSHSQHPGNRFSLFTHIFHLLLHHIFSLYPSVHHFRSMQYFLSPTFFRMASSNGYCG